jgi:general secretion pathway protein A
VIYEQFFSFMGLREDPFHVSPDPRFYYSTPAHESALAELLYGIETRQGFLVLTGEAGTGKTCLLNEILDWLRRRGRSSAYIFHTHLEPIGLFRFILSDFGVPCQSKSKSDLVNALHTWLLQRHAAQDLPVLILDEAQALPLQTLDEVRLLLNLETPRGKLLQIILSGQPELDEKLRLPVLRQLRQRVMFHSRLPVLTQKETAAYISSRLATAGCSDSSLFPDEVVQDIYTSSRGIPRIVNLLCEHALISAYAERQLVVSPEMIQRIAADFDLLAKPLPVIDSELQSNYVRFAPFPVIKKPRPPAMANQLTALSWWEQIDFDVFKDLDKRTQPAVKEDPVPAVPLLAPVECPKPVARPAYASTPGRSSEVYRYWRRHRSRWAVAVFARNSAASVQRAWHAFIHPFVCYARSVSRSFVHDCRRLFRVLTLPAPALEHDSSTEAANEKSAARRNVLAPVVNWLRQPVTPANISSNRSLARSAHRNVLAPVVNWLRRPVTPANTSSNRSPARSAHRR